jgi:hypothetical protein
VQDKVSSIFNDRMEHFKGAYEDAELALKEIGFAYRPMKCSLYPLALLARADASYNLGDFEAAIQDYHSGIKLRPDMDAFRLGIERTEETISSSIAARREWDHLGRAEEIRAKKLAIQNQYKMNSSDDENPPDTQRKDRDKFLLEGMYEDKLFLLELQSDRVMTEAGEGSVGVMIEDALEYLASRSDFWAQRKLPRAPKSRPASARTYSRPLSAARKRPASASVVRFHDSESTMISRYVRPQSATVRSRPQSAASTRARPQSAASRTGSITKVPLYARTTSASSKKSTSAEELAKRSRGDSGVRMTAWIEVPKTVKERFEAMKKVYLGASHTEIL